MSVTVKIEADGKPCKLSTVAPLAATQSTTLGKGVSVPRNQCITAGFADTFPQDCGYPQIYGANASSVLNATATIGSDGSSLVLTASAPAGFQAVATSYGRASWPRTVFYAGDLPVSLSLSLSLSRSRSRSRSLSVARARAGSVAHDCASAGCFRQVIPWYADMSASNTWTPPKSGGWAADEPRPTVRGPDQMEYASNIRLETFSQK